jgi:hypothetical protein
MDSGGPTDAGGGQDSAVPDAPYEGGPLNGCTPDANFVNEEALLATREFDFTTDASAQYTLRGHAANVAPCMQIKRTQNVTWRGLGGATFTRVPLAPAGGTVPTPIKAQDGGNGTYTVAFPNAGVYGFENPQDPAKMFGAVQVQ